MPYVLIAILVLVAVAATIFVVVRRRGGAPARSTVAESGRPPRLSREGLGSRIRQLLGGAPDRDAWAALEETLVKADVGPGTSQRIVADLKERLRADADPAVLLREEIESILGPAEALDLPEGRLAVVMVVGVNGSGKTTTIGKLAALLSAGGKRVSIAGTDTFRAAASEQLDVWADRAGAHLVSQQRGADPGAVAFDAVSSATARGSDVLIVDTAGRLHTKTPLMDELEKVRRVLEKAAGTPPDETLLVLDATTGQNGIAQATAFARSVGVTGVALAKMDGTAKGGIVLAVREQLGVPVKFVGTGEKVEDLSPFDPRTFAARLVGD